MTDGGLWLWGEVVAALNARGEDAEEMNYPSRRDIQLIGGNLAAYAIDLPNVRDYLINGVSGGFH